MKKIEWKPILTAIFLIIFQSIFFWTSKAIQGQAHLIGNVIDTKIPFNIWFMIPYCIWYFLIIIVPYILYKKNKDSFIRYIYSYMICTIVANIIFVAYPTTVIRPEVAPTNILTGITHLIFLIDTPILNCFPSLHCAMSILFMTSILENKNINVFTKVIITIICLFIMASTLFVKQHVFIDLVSGDIIATIVYFFVKRFYKENNRIKKLLKL